MKVLFWSEFFWPDISGVSVIGIDLMTALQDCGHNFIVVASHGKYALPDKTLFNDIPVYRFPFQKVLASRNLSAIQQITGEIKQLKRQFLPDLIHINSSEPSLFFHERTKRIVNAPILVTVHMLLTKDYSRNAMYARLLKSADWVTAVSEAMLKDARSYVPEIKVKSSLIKNSLKTPAIASKPISFSPPRILCLGRLSVEKGFDIALDAFSNVLNEYPEAQLIITGEGPAMDDLQKQAVELGINDNIEFTGSVNIDQVPEVINSSTMVIIPSRWREPFCIVALQAGQMSRPVIAAEVGGLPEIVVHGESGLLFEKGNSNALADRVLHLLNNPIYAETLGNNARIKIVQDFSFRHFIDEYNSVYRKLLRSEQ